MELFHAPSEFSDENGLLPKPVSQCYGHSKFAVNSQFSAFRPCSSLTFTQMPVQNSKECRRMSFRIICYNIFQLFSSAWDDLKVVFWHWLWLTKHLNWPNYTFIIFDVEAVYNAWCSRLYSSGSRIAKSFADDLIASQILASHCPALLVVTKNDTLTVFPTLKHLRLFHVLVYKFAQCIDK